MSRSNPVVWSWSTGRKAVNRVRVRERTEGCIRIVVHERERSLRHKDREKAKRQAREVAAKIHPGSRPQRNRGNIMAALADLKRVAREEGVVEGIAPPMSAYKEKGRYGVPFVCGQFSGYYATDGDRSPRDGWCEAMKKYGLKPYRARWSPKHSGLVLLDLRRVALETGQPARMPFMREYDEHGKWTRSTVINRLGVGNWSEAAEMAGLEMTPRKGLTTPDSENDESNGQERAA